MPYKDKEKAKQASRERMRQHRAQGVTKGVTSTGVTLHPAIIADINRLTTRPDGSVDEQARTNRMATARAYFRMYPDKQYTGIAIAPEDIPASPVPVRVSKPGDADYVPMCETTRNWKGGP